MIGRVARSLRADHRLLAGIVTVLVASGLVLLVFSGVIRNLFSNSGQSISAVFRSAAVLHTGAPVRVDGVDEGQVTGVSLGPRGRAATVTMTVHGAALPLYADATATLKWRTVLGGSYYVDLHPGSPLAGLNVSHAIPLSHTQTQVDLDEILAAVRAPQRAGLQTMLAELPQAAANLETPAEAFSLLATTSPSLAAGLSALRGARTDFDLRELVVNGARTVSALDTPTNAVQRLIQSGATTFGVAAAHGRDLQESFSRAAVTLPQLKSTLSELNSTLNLADPLISRLQAVSGEVGPTLNAVRPVLVHADTLLNHARPLLDSLSRTTPTLRAAAERAAPVLRGIAPSLTRLQETVLPDLAKTYAGSRRTTYEMIGPTVEALQAIASNVDDISHIVSLSAAGGERALDTLPCRTYLTDPSATQLMQCETIAQALNSILTYQPIPGAKK